MDGKFDRFQNALIEKNTNKKRINNLKNIVTEGHKGTRDLELKLNCVKTFKANSATEIDQKVQQIPRLNHSPLL